MKIKKSYLYLIGIVIFIIILAKLNLFEIYKILKNINLFYFILVIILILPCHLLKALRWNYLKKLQNINYSFFDSLTMYFSGLYVGLITPGRVGEFVKVIYLKRDGYSIGRSFVSVFLDRIFDIAFLFLFGYIGMAIFINLFRREFYYFSVVFAVILVILIFLVFHKKSSGIILKILLVFVPRKYKEKVETIWHDFYNDFKLLNKKNIFVLSLITLASWLVYYFYMQILAIAIGLNISFLYLAACVTIAGFFTLIPISVSGIGTRDIILIALFSILGIPKETAVAFSLLILFLIIFVALIGLVCWFKKPIKTKSSELNSCKPSDNSN